jgi:hypothetical protein
LAVIDSLDQAIMLYEDAGLHGLANKVISGRHHYNYSLLMESLKDSGKRAFFFKIMSGYSSRPMPK